MAKDSSFYDYVLNDLFSEISGISSRSMFGGYGFYYRGVFFALIADGKLYFKAGEENKKDFLDYGSVPFIYTGHKGKDVTMSYFELPANIMDDKTLILEWVEKSAALGVKKKR